MNERCTKDDRLSDARNASQWTVAALFLGCSLVATSGQAATYYVAKTGSDSTSCSQAQNISTPKLTVGAGASCMASGDTLYIRAGTYTAARNSVLLPSGSSWTSPTTVSRYANETVILQPNPFRTYNATLSYVVYDGFILDGTGQGWTDGISIGQGPHHLRFTNIEVRNYGANGISPSSDGNEFRNCRIHHGGTTDFDNAFYIIGSNNVVDNCEIYNWAGAAVQIYSGGSTTTLNGNIISRNRIHDTSGGIAGSSNTNTGGYTNGWRTNGIIVQNASNTVVWGNVIYNLRATSSPRYAISAGSSAFNTSIYNNTIFNNPTEGIEIYQSDTTKIRNNILYRNTLGNVLNEGTNVTFSVNICDTSGTGCNLVGDPAFVDVSVANVRLRAGSPALDVGVDVSAAGVVLDIDGTTRPQQGAYDLGAFEYHAVAALPASPTNVRILR
jgi:parallel beta-helix repeat protein